MATIQIDKNYNLATGILLARRLVKGYSERMRGDCRSSTGFSPRSSLAGPRRRRAWMSRLISAALRDESGEALDGALHTLRSL